ncbi:MAG: glycosyltransferase family 4 protein [Verrucomicrobiota bacterium]
MNDNPVACHFSALARQLVTRGHQVVMVTPHRKVELENRHGNPAIYTWPSERPTHLRDAVFFARLVRQYRTNCLIANFGAVNLMTIVGWLTGVPNRIAWYHTLSAQLSLDRDSAGLRAALLDLRKRCVYKLATLIVANSQASCRDAIRTYKIPSRKCQVRYFSLPDPPPTPALGRAPTLCCVGRFHRCKGQDVFLRAIRLLNLDSLSPKVEFVGTGPEERNCRELARKLGVADQCEFTGAVSHGEVLARMARATATIVPSRAEAFGLTTVESLAVGTPVVASSVGGIPEVVRDGVDGFLVPPDDPAALAAKVKLLLSDVELRRKMSLNARERFLSTFEQGKVVEEQADWLENITPMSQGTSNERRQNGAPA